MCSDSSGSASPAPQAIAHRMRGLLATREVNQPAHGALRCNYRSLGEQDVGLNAVDKYLLRGLLCMAPRIFKSTGENA
jgi:hypothetical protein